MKKTALRKLFEQRINVRTLRTYVVYANNLYILLVAVCVCFDIRWKSNHIKKEYTSLIIKEKSREEEKKDQRDTDDLQRSFCWLEEQTWYSCKSRLYVYTHTLYTYVSLGVCNIVE